MPLAALLFCALSSRAAPAASGRRFSRSFGEQRKFSARLLPKAFGFQADGSMGNASSSTPAAVDADTRAAVASSPVVLAVVAGPASDIGPYLRMRSPLVDSQRLIDRAAFGSLKPSVRLPLKKEHEARKAERDSLLGEADSIDALANNRLDPWKQRLDSDLAKLDAETDLYKADATIFRSRCAPARDAETWKWCGVEITRLNEWLASLTKRGDAYNDELEKFHVESRPYDARVAVLTTKIESWEQDVNKLVARIEDALKKNVGTCTVEQYDRLDDAITKLCKQTKWSCAEDQTCVELLANLNAGQKCFDARKAMMDECFGGGDPIHDNVLVEVKNGIDRCRRIYRTKCEGAGAAGEPP